MTNDYTNEPMLEMFIFETTQQIEQLEKCILECERDKGLTHTAINDIFRVMHTIKGSSAMMMFSDISMLAHTIEDVFYCLREDKPEQLDYTKLCDLVLDSVDFIKIEVEKIKNGDRLDGDASSLDKRIKEFLVGLKNIENSDIDMVKNTDTSDSQQYYIMQDKVVSELYKNIFKAVVYFEDGCAMENIRAYTIIHNLQEFTNKFYHIPEDIIDNDNSSDVIKQNGFVIYLKTNLTYEQMHDFFMQTIFLKDLELDQIEDDSEFTWQMESSITNNSVKVPIVDNTLKIEGEHVEHHVSSNVQSMISVNVKKLDILMDLVGEMVIAEAMVIQNPDLAGLELDNFQKAASQLDKITGEIQDMVMSIRMVPLLITFQKMNRIVRDMSKKLHKDVNLHLVGEDTEVDKNIIEHISDPLMHLVRNSIDHGIEDSQERIAKKKPKVGTITLEAKNVGSDVLIIVKDDGKGLDKDKIIKKASDNGLLYRDTSEMSDKEIYNLILSPGFSTKENISEFSGRGVGMDVVAKNIEAIGGSVSVDSIPDKGTIITLKMPLTLAIIDGMNIKVGHSCYTIPTMSIKEFFRPVEKDLIIDPNGNEMIMVRGKIYPILSLHKFYNTKTEITEFTKGMIIMIEQDENTLCVFADELVGQQQVVVKALPEYIKRFKKIKGLAGCTLLGDGSISLILDVSGLKY